MDAISAFGDEAADAGRYADVLAAASSNANTNVAGLGEAFKYVAPVAGALGYSVEDTAVALGLMANAGIKGSSAGTALRGALTNLASPTKAMKNTMDELGISILDANGEMKPLDELLGHLRESFSGLSEEQQASAAATIFGKEAMAGMLAIINASESDYQKLTKAIAESEGVAADMAETMGDNLQGKLINLQSAIEELGIKIFEALEPALTWLVNFAQSVVDAFNEMDASTQQVVVAIGAVIAAIGPLMVIGGTLLTGIGSLMTFLPAMLPLITAIAPAVMLVVGAVTALGVAYGLTREKADEQLVSDKKVAEQSLKTAEAHNEVLEKKLEDIASTGEMIAKHNEQVESLDELAFKYEHLAEKSKLTNEEFLEYLTLSTELENTTTPERVAELSEKMEALREKSGLTKEEFEELVKTNGALAELFPDSTVAVDEYGNALMGTAANVRDLTAAEMERLQIEIYNKMVEDLQAANVEIENYQATLDAVADSQERVTELSDEQKQITSEIGEVTDQIESKNAEIEAIKQQISEASVFEKMALIGQKDELLEQLVKLQSKKSKLDQNKKVVDDTLKTEKKTNEELKKSRDNTQKIVAESRKNFDALVEVLATQFDINIEKGKEVESIGKAIDSNQKNIDKLKEQVRTEGDSNGKKQEAIKKLEEQKRKLEEAKRQLEHIKTELDAGNRKVDEGNIKQAQKNAKTQEEGRLLDGNNTKAGNLNKKLDKKHTKNVTIKQSKDPDAENRKWSQPISKVVNLIGKAIGFAEGTDYAPGGSAFLGEEGPEMVRTPQGKMGIVDFGYYDLPKGSKVWTAEETKSMLRNGVVQGLNQGVSATKQENQPTEQKHIFNIEPSPIYLDGRVIGQATFETVNEKLGTNQNIRNLTKGVR